MGEGDAEGPDGVVRPAGELLAEHGIAPVELREKEGLALLNGTDGMLGMLVMALRRPGQALQVRRHHRRALPGGPARHGQGPRARAARHPPAPRAGGLRRQHAGRAEGFGAHRAPPGRRAPRPGRLLRALRSAGRRRRARHPGARAARRRAGTGLRGRQSRRPAGRAGRVQRQLPRCPGRLRPRLPRHRRRRPRVDRGAAHGPAARQEPRRTGCRRSSRTTPGSTPG